MHRHNAKGGHSLVPVRDMIAFTNQFSPGLYEMVLNSITRDNTSYDRYVLQEKRACAILHSLVYYRYCQDNDTPLLCCQAEPSCADNVHSQVTVRTSSCF